MVKHVGWHQRQSDESGAYQLQTVAPEPNLTVIQTHIAVAVGVPMQTRFSGCFWLCIYILPKPVDFLPHKQFLNTVYKHCEQHTIRNPS